MLGVWFCPGVVLSGVVYLGCGSDRVWFCRVWLCRVWFIRGVVLTGCGFERCGYLGVWFCQGCGFDRPPYDVCVALITQPLV